MINNYISEYPSNLKKNILDIYNKDSTFKKFLNCCINMKIKILNKNENNYNFIGHDNLLKKILDLKTIYIKNFGIKVFKKIPENLKTSTFELDRGSCGRVRGCDGQLNTILF